MPLTTFLASQTLALLAMIGTPELRPDRRIEIPLDPAAGCPSPRSSPRWPRPVASIVERPAVSLTLPTRGLGGSLARTLLGECLGTEVEFVFRPGLVVMVVDEQSLGADRRAEWKRRLEDLSTRSIQASKRQQYYGMSALPSYRANDPRRPTICLVHGINSSSGGFVHLIRPLEQAGYGIVVFDYPYNQRLENSCAQFRKDWQSFRKEAGEKRPWAILAHSMGALVARSYVEGEGRTQHDVSSLILIAPVNQGAHVARIQPLYQTLSSLFAINSKRTSQALAQLSDGIGQAADDLLPGSAFLRRLNGGTRPPTSRTTSSRVTSASSPAMIASKPRPSSTSAPSENGLLCIFSRVASRELASLLDELTDGSGDGCVAVERTRLAGRRRSRHHPRQSRRADPRSHVLSRRGPVPCLPHVLRWLEADLKRRGAIDAAPGGIVPDCHRQGSALTYSWQ